MQDSATSLSEILLERLEDIHGAAEPAWWPPAPGWWLVAALLLAAFVLALVWLSRRLRAHLRRRRLLGELEGLEESLDPVSQPAAYLAALNQVFRVIALRAFPRSECARLQGEDWVAFIRNRMPAGGNGESLAALAAGPYQPSPRFNASDLQDQARRWVAQYG
jgi:hypothetical protein